MEERLVFLSTSNGSYLRGDNVAHLIQGCSGGTSNCGDAGTADPIALTWRPAFPVSRAVCVDLAYSLSIV